MPKRKPSADTPPEPSGEGERRRSQRPILPGMPEVGSARPPGELFDVLWRLHLETMRTGDLDTAFHILAAALHAAERTGTVALVTGVENLAALHQATIDSLDPPTAHSTAAAAQRGTIPSFASLQGRARGVADRMNAKLTVRGRHAPDHRNERSPGQQEGG